jgi:hypothetical protein
VNVLSDSFSVLLSHWQLVLGILLIMLLGQMLAGSALRLIFRDSIATEDYFALSTTGLMLPISLASVLWLALGALLPGTAGAAFVLLIVAILAIVLLIRNRKESRFGSKTALWVLVAVFSMFLFLRLAFVAKVIIPLYFDSAQHYLIIKNLLAENQISALGSPTGNYYHIGFHLLTAWTASLLRAEAIDAILIGGQMMVATIPLALFCVVRQETQSHLAAMFGVLLAAFGWYMPAYAANWGKYPALTSLPLITFVLSLAYLTLRHKDVLTGRKFLWAVAILLTGVLITILFHSRSLVVFGVFALAWALVIGWQRLPIPLRVVSFLAVLGGIILFAWYLPKKDVFGLLFDPYWSKGLVVTAGVLFLAVFAQWRYPRLAFASLLVILFLLGTLLIPIRVPGYGMLTLLDRPFVEMILYLPLSVLGGLGLAGLEGSLQNLLDRLPGRHFRKAGYLSGLIIVLLLINTFANYNFYQADCCNIVGRDDLVAIDWIDKNLPSEARIAIASTELRVFISDSPQGAAGGDAGIWITPLTGRTTIPLPYQSDFSQRTVFDAICRWDADYLYVGDTGVTFNNGLLSTYPDRYKILLSMPKAKLYQVVGCPQSQ